MTATENYQNYLKDKEAELLPVFVTCNEEKEYNNVNNWTKSMIVKRIEEMLLQYPDINKAKGYLTFLKKAKNGEKASIICLYNEVKEQFDSLVTTHNLSSEIQECCDAISHDHIYWSLIWVFMWLFDSKTFLQRNSPTFFHSLLKLKIV